MPTTLEVKFGDALLEHGFTSIPNLVLESYAALGLTSNEMLFIIHVWKYWWTEKNPHPSIQRIADTMGVNRVQIYRYAKSLEEKGFLQITQRFDERNQQQTNEYDFTPLIEAVTRGIAGTQGGGLQNRNAPPLQIRNTNKTKTRKTS